MEMIKSKNRIFKVTKFINPKAGVFFGGGGDDGGGLGTLGTSLTSGIGLRLTPLIFKGTKKTDNHRYFQVSLTLSKRKCDRIEIENPSCK